MIAVLINSADVRLGEVRVSWDCKLIQFGGGYFVKTADAAILTEPTGERGVVFVMAEIHVLENLDVFNPTSNFSKRASAK